jgi:hypothetical protein
MSVSVFETRLRAGIARTSEFARKQLAEFAVNVGTKWSWLHVLQLGRPAPDAPVVQGGRAQPVRERLCDCGSGYARARGS